MGAEIGAKAGAIAGSVEPWGRYRFRLIYRRINRWGSWIFYW